MSGLSPQKLKELQLFVQFIKANPDALNLEELKFFKEYLISMGATKIPPPKPTKDTKEESQERETPKQSEKKEERAPSPPPEEEEEAEEPEQPEQPDEPDPELLPPDNDPPQEMGDPNIEVTDEMMEKAAQLKAQALEQQTNGNFVEAIRLYTEAIKLNPHIGMLYAARASCFLQQKKPNAAIRDCDVSIKKNPDSAKAYKIRGRAKRFLGLYEEALRDLQMACKLDYDDATYALSKVVAERVQKIVEKRKRQAERERKKQERERRKREAEERKKAETKQEHTSGPTGGFSGGFPGGAGGVPFGMESLLGAMNDPEVKELLEDPDIQAKLMQAMNNPALLAQQMATNPKLAKLVQKMSQYMNTK
jgi:suppressor of tumorigenicity protein 13